MRTVTYKSVVERASALFSGKLNATREDWAVLNVLINSRYREFFEAFFWREWTVVERRTFREAYAAGTTYAAGDEVYFPATESYYQALRATTGNAPATESGGAWETNDAYWAAAVSDYTGDDWSGTVDYVAGDIVYQPDNNTYYQAHTASTNQEPPNASYWGALTEFERTIDLSGGNQGASATAIGEVKAVWPNNPRSHENLLEQRFDLTPDAILVRGTEPVVWVEFRLRPNSFTGDTWASGSFSVGDQVYYSTTGEYYVCIAAATTQAPTDTTKWTKLDFPYILKEAVSQAAYADMLKATGKHSKFLNELGEARRLLQREFDKLERQQGQTKQLNVQVR